jgi:hypothetical protein
MTDDDYKYIYTTRRVYRLPGDAKGIPIEEAYPDAQMPEFLKGAVVYDTPRGRIIAHQEKSARDGEADKKDAGAARRRAVGKDAAADPWRAVKITCREVFAVHPDRHGIEDSASAARAVRALLKRHFPEGPAMAARSLKAARIDRSDLALRWSDFCRDYASSLKEAQAAGLAPAACNPYADIDFSAAIRERRGASKARNRDRDGFER